MFLSQTRKLSATCRWSVAFALLQMFYLLLKLSSLETEKRETGDTPAAGDLLSNHSTVDADRRKRKKQSVRIAPLADTEAIGECCNALLVELDLVFKLSSLKVEKGEAGDTLRAGDVLLNLSSLKAETRRRKNLTRRYVPLADTKTIRDLQMECCNRPASDA